jgi:hypothetical protein
MQQRNGRTLARVDLSLRLFVFLDLAMVAPTFPVQALAQSNDITLSLGATLSQSRGFRSPTTGATQTSADISLGVNYGRRFLDAEVAELYGEIESVALPNRGLTAATATVPQNYASLYVAPGLRLKVLPSARLSPWFAIAGGYALYEQSAKLSSGQNTTNKFLSRAVFDFGGGLDYKVFRVPWATRRGSRFFVGESESECRAVFEYAAQCRGKWRR